MHVRKGRKRGRYRVKVYVHGRKLADKSFSDRKLAEAFHAEKVLEAERVRAGLATMAARKTKFKPFAEQWLEKVKGEKTSWRSDEKNLRLYLMPQFENELLQGLTVADIDERLTAAAKRGGLSPATYNRVRSTLMSIFTSAVKKDLLKQNPVEHAERKSEKTKTRKVGYWSEEAHIETYLAAARLAPSPFAVAAALLLGTGCRAGEVCGLRCGDLVRSAEGGAVLKVTRIFDQTFNQVVDRTKSGDGAGRYVPVPAWLEEVLLPAIAGRRQEDLIICKPDGSPIHPDWLLRQHDKVVAAAKLPRITVHDLRRTFATRMKSFGMAKDDIQAILGHSSLLTTDVYAKTTREAVAALSRRWTQAGPKRSGSKHDE